MCIYKTYCRKINETFSTTNDYFKENILDENPNDNDYSAVDDLTLLYNKNY
jgi:hypothetical protein